MIRTLLFLSLLITSFAACNKTGNDAVNNNIDSTQPKEMKNIAYGTGADQNMDVYLPANRSMATTKAIILIHGGAWISGDKADFDSIVKVLRVQAPDYAFFNINYRLANLSGGNPWPTQYDDVNKAFDFIVSKASEYKFNQNKIVIGGASAGAHLALLKAYKANSGNRIKAVVDLFGPTDMKGMYQHDPNYALLFNGYFGGTPTTNAAAYEAASPLYAVNSSSPPTIIFHGGADMVVPKSQSDSLNTRLANAGVVKQYYVYPTEGHSWYGANLNDTFIKMLAFLSQHNP